MEVRPGYKQTDVGMIPQEWDAPTLGELFTFKNGLNKAKEFFGYGTPIVNYMDVYGKRGLSARDIHGRVNVSKEELKTFEVRKGDVFFTRTSETAEEIGITSVMLNESPATVFSGFVLRARPKDDSLDNQFKKYCFSTYEVRRQITSKTTETTRALTNGRYLSDVTIARPDKLEQRVIAEALSDVDVLMDALTRLIAKKRDLKRAAMQQLLSGLTRLPGFSGEWKVKRLEEIGGFSKGKGIRKDETVSSGFPCIRYGEIYTHHNDVIRKFYSFIPRELTTQSQRLRKGDLLFAGSGETAEEIGKCVAFLGDEEAYAGGDIVILSPVGQNSIYLGYLMNYASIVEQKAQMGQGDAVVHISARNLGQLQLRLPLQAEQAAIAAVLSDMDAELMALAARLAKTRALKQGMMQELLTGKKRLI